jgi:hypothetical protein
MRETLPGADLFDPAPVKGTTCTSTPRQKARAVECDVQDTGAGWLQLVQNFCGTGVQPYDLCTAEIGQ